MVHKVSALDYTDAVVMSAQGNLLKVSITRNESPILPLSSWRSWGPESKSVDADVIAHIVMVINYFVVKL